MSAVVDNVEWKLQNEKFRSPKSRRPDVYYIGPTKNKKYVILADGWDAPGKRRQKWVPTVDTTKPAIDKFGREEAAKLAEFRGLSAASGDVGGCAEKRTTPSKARRANSERSLDEALSEIEADASAGVNARTGGNTAAGCRVIREGLPPDRLAVPVRRLTPKEFERHVKRTIVENPELTVTTKEHYLSQARSVVQILTDDYGLDEDCKAAIRTPSNMTGAEADERPFRLSDIWTMENRIEGDKTIEVLGNWADTIRGAYYGGTNCAFQPVDLAFLKWSYIDQDLKFIDGRRFKTGIPFYIAISRRFRRWLLRRRAKGGVWAKGYIFPEFVFGIRACLNSTGPLSILTDKQEEDIETNVTERLRDYFNKFLNQVCEIKRPGITYKSFRHYILPYLRSQNVPAEVGKDMAGQVTLEAYLGYGGHGAPQQHMRATGLLEDHFLNVKEGKNETIILTNRDLAQHLEKVQLKGLKKLLLAYQDSTKEVTRKIDQVAVAQANGFEMLNAQLVALRLEVQQLRNSKPERVIVTCAQICSFAPIQNLCCRHCAARLEAKDASTPIEIESYSI